MAKKGESLRSVREGLVDTTGRISAFWGFGKVMGQLYGLLYLSENPMSLDEMAESLAISKGNVSVNIRSLERWSMVRRVWVKGDRRDYYEAEVDLWSIVKGVLREREQKEFAQALDAIGEFRETAEQLEQSGRSPEAAFAAERLEKLEDFIITMDKMVGVVLTLDDLKRNLFDWPMDKRR